MSEFLSDHLVTIGYILAGLMVVNSVAGLIVSIIATRRINRIKKS